MNRLACWLIFAVIINVWPATAEEPESIAAKQQRIAEDYQRVARTKDAGATAAAGRLARNAYRRLIEESGGFAGKSADDLRALAAAHEALGDLKQARELYSRSVEADPRAETHLGLARVTLIGDLKACERHFDAALQLQPDDPSLKKFHLFLAAAHRRQHDL